MIDGRWQEAHANPGSLSTNRGPIPLACANRGQQFFWCEAHGKGAVGNPKIRQVMRVADWGVARNLEGTQYRSMEPKQRVRHPWREKEDTSFRKDAQRVQANGKWWRCGGNGGDARFIRDNVGNLVARERNVGAVAGHPTYCNASILDALPYAAYALLGRLIEREVEANPRHISPNREKCYLIRAYL